MVSTRARAPIEYIVISLVRGRGVPAHEGRIPRPDGEISVRHGQRCLGYGVVFPATTPALGSPHCTVSARFFRAAYTSRFSWWSPFPFAIVVHGIPDILFLGGFNRARHHRCLPLSGAWNGRRRRRLPLSVARHRHSAAAADRKYRHGHRRRYYSTRIWDINIIWDVCGWIMTSPVPVTTFYSSHSHRCGRCFLSSRYCLFFLFLFYNMYMAITHVPLIAHHPYTVFLSTGHHHYALLPRPPSTNLLAHQPTTHCASSVVWSSSWWPVRVVHSFVLCFQIAL